MPMHLIKTVVVEEVIRTWTMQQDYVLIEDFGTPEYVVGSVITIAGSKVKPDIRFGKVLKVGPGKRRWSKTLKQEILIPMDVKEGDFIIYFKHHGTHTCYQSEDGLILRVLDHASQILGIITEPPVQLKTMDEFEAHLRKNAFFEMQV